MFYATTVAHGISCKVFILTAFGLQKISVSRSLLKCLRDENPAGNIKNHIIYFLVKIILRVYLAHFSVQSTPYVISAISGISFVKGFIFIHLHCGPKQSYACVGYIGASLFSTGNRFHQSVTHVMSHDCIAISRWASPEHFLGFLFYPLPSSHLLQSPYSACRKAAHHQGRWGVGGGSMGNKY